MPCSQACLFCVHCHRRVTINDSTGERQVTRLCRRMQTVAISWKCINTTVRYLAYLLHSFSSTSKVGKVRRWKRMICQHQLALIGWSDSSDARNTFVILFAYCQKRARQNLKQWKTHKNALVRSKFIVPNKEKHCLFWYWSFFFYYKS